MDKTKTSIDHRELLRKSFDKIRVNNPFNEDIVVRWDGFPHVIPHNGYAIKERYIAEKYLRETAKRYLVQKNDKLRDEENAKRIAKGVGKMNRWMEEQTFETDLYANWPQKQLQAIKELNLYGGVVEEYGMDRVPGEGVTVQPIDPNTSLIEQLDRPDILNTDLSHSQVSGEQKLTAPEPAPVEAPAFTQPQVDIAPPPAEPMPSIIDELEAKTQPQLRAIAKEKGITTQPTDKKVDLIAVITAA